MSNRHERPVHTATTMPTERGPGCPSTGTAGRRPPTRPISRYTFPDGRQGPLITGYDLTRSVLAGPRFGSRLAIPANQVPLRPEPPTSTG